MTNPRRLTNNASFDGFASSVGFSLGDIDLRGQVVKGAQRLSLFRESMVVRSLPEAEVTRNDPRQACL
jgi:hypothetical protein